MVRIVASVFDNAKLQKEAWTPLALLKATRVSASAGAVWYVMSVSNVQDFPILTTGNHWNFRKTGPDSAADVECCMDFITVDLKTTICAV